MSFGDKKRYLQDIAILSLSARAPVLLFSLEDKNTETKDRSIEDPRKTRTDTQTHTHTEREKRNECYFKERLREVTFVFSVLRRLNS